MDKYFLPLILFIIYASVSLMWTSSEKNAAFVSLFTIISCFLLLYAVTRVIRNKDDFSFVLKAYLLGTYILILYLLIYYGWSGLINIMGEERQRIALDITQPNSVGQFTALSSLMAVYLGREERKKRYFAIAVPLLFFLLASGSRGSFFAFVSGLIVLVFAGTRARSKAIGLTTFLLLLFIMYLVSQLSIFDRVFGRFSSFFSFFSGEKNTDSSTLARFDLISNGLKIFKRKPVFGHGVNAFSYEFQSMMYMMNMFSSPHSMYVYTMVNHGLIGAFLWFFTPVKLLVQFIKQKNATKLFPLVLLLTWMVLGMFTDLVQDKNTYIILGFCIVHIRTYSFDDISIYRRNERNEKNLFH